MFTIHCTTCDAKLAVRNDELVGQILACPKCGGMVLVKRPEDEPIDLALAEEPQPTSKFPDPATYETDSGIMKPDEVEAIMAAQRRSPQNPPTPPSLLTETELRTRKILLGVLVGLLLVLVLAVGGLIAVKGSVKNNRSKTPQGPEVIAVDRPVVPEEPPKPVEPVMEPVEGPSAEPDEEKPEPPEPVAPPQESTGEKEDEKEEKRELLAKLLSQTPKPPTEEPVTESDETPTPAEPVAEVRSTNDLLSSLERKMPGLLRPDEMISVDISARLALPLTELKLDDTPLLAFVRAFTEWTEIPVTLDVNEFRCRGIRVDTPLTESFEAGTFGDTLTKLLARLELEPVVEDRQILVTVPEESRSRLLERMFGVSDFVEKTQETPENRLTAERLVEILRRLIDPVGFSAKQPEGDKPAMRIDGNTLVVRHRLRMLDETLRVLEQLRVIRGLPQTTEVTGEHLAPEAFGWDEMVKPMTLNYYQPTPLTGILAQLEEKTKLKILVDHRALHRALCPLSTMRATVRCNHGTVNEALENLLASIDVATLTYRIVDYDVLEITTAYAARQPENMSIEVHRFETPGKPLAGDETPENLVRTIRSALEPDSWHNPDDPETLGAGDIVIDQPSGCLIVRQSQPVQRQLRLWLGKKFAVEAPEE